MNVRLAVRWLEKTLLGGVDEDARSDLTLWLDGDDEAVAARVAAREQERQDQALEHVLMAGGEVADAGC